MRIADTFLLLPDTLLMMLESKRKQLRPSRHHWNIIMGSCDFWDQVRILAYKTGKEELLEPGEKTLDEMLEEYSESGRALPDWDRKFERQKYVPPDAMEVILLLDTAIKSKDYRRVDRALKVAEHLTFMGTALQQKTIVPSSNGVYSDNFPRMREVYWDACEVLLENKNISDKRKAQIQGWKDSGLFPIIQGKLEARKPTKKQKLLEERRTPEQVLKQLREGKSAASPQYKFKLPAVKPRPVEDFSPSVTKATEEFQPLASEAA